MGIILASSGAIANRARAKEIANTQAMNRIVDAVNGLMKENRALADRITMLENERAQERPVENIELSVTKMGPRGWRERTAPPDEIEALTWFANTLLKRGVAGFFGAGPTIGKHDICVTSPYLVPPINITSVEYSTDGRHTTTCTASFQSGSVEVMAKSLCREGDRFDATYGELLAFWRCIGKFHRAVTS